MESLPERLQRDLKEDPSSVTEASGSQAGAVRDNGWNLSERAGNSTADSGSDQQSSDPLYAAREFLRVKKRLDARRLTDIFATLFPLGGWEKASYVCYRCRLLANSRHTTFLHSQAFELNHYDVIVLDPIQREALKGCGSCQFMLSCLQQAVFSPETSKAPRTTKNITHKYQLILDYDNQECLVKLESVYVDEEKTKSLAAYEEKTESLGSKLSKRVAKIQQTRNRYYNAVVYSHILASCSLVVCEADGASDTKANNYIHKDPGSAKSVSLVLRWLKECQKHENCPPQTEVRLPTRVINIADKPGTNPSLWATSGKLGKYVALTHCWGGSVTVKTTVDTIKAHESEIVLQDLPQNFQDAINIAHKLGFKYLWIDSLCIIQDSVQDWAIECSKMSEVYANATIVIGAAAAANSTQGFLNHRSFGQGPMLNNGRKYFLREKITTKNDQTSSPLSSRGWAYQEALLAPRLLLYGSRQMSWECRDGIKYEGDNVTLSSNASCSKKQFYRIIDSTLPAASIQTTSKDFELASDTMFTKSICDRLNIWCGCVEDYSLRQLTQASDKLPALSGLASKLYGSIMGEYLAGIWSKDLGTGLFWARHTTREELYGRPFFKYPKFRAPSWSWASCEGPVNFRVEYNASSRPALVTDVGYNNDRSNGIGYCAAKLVDYKIFLATSDRYGQVSEGSYITLEGFWKTMYPYTPAPEVTKQEKSRWPPSRPNAAKDPGSFTIRLDHSSGIQEKCTWLGNNVTPGSRLLFLLSASRCLILKSVENDCWERDGCCVLPRDQCPGETDLYGWAKSKFKLV